MKIDVFSVCYNEQIIIPFFLNHYKGCNITVYDNGSDDLSVSLLKCSGVTVIPFDTNGYNSESAKTELKNNCWKKSKADAVIVVDMDEFVDFKNFNGTISKCIGYEMLGVTGMGVPSDGYDKVAMFNQREIKEINYGVGCHVSNPKGDIVWGDRIKLCHYKWLSYQYVVDRYKILNSRQNEENKANCWDVHYAYPESVLQKFYENLCLTSRMV